MSDDRRPELERHARLYARHGFAVVFTEPLATGDAKRVRTPEWEKTPPLQNHDGGDYAAGVIGARGLTRNVAINLRTSNLVGIEADGPDDVARVLALGLPETLTAQSSRPDKLHWHYRPPPALDGTPEYVSFRFEGTVVAVKNNYYVSPPSLHPSGAVYTLVGGVELDEIPEIPLAAYLELVGMAGKQAPGARKARVPRQAAETVPVGQRRAVALSLAGAIRRQGGDVNTIVAAIEADQERSEEPLDADELRALADDVVERYAPADNLVTQPLTDLGNARRFVTVHEGRFLHAREERTWLEWRDGRWRRDVTGAAERAAKQVVEMFWAQLTTITDGKAREAAAKWAIACQSAGRLRAMLELASTELPLVVTSDELDRDPYLLSCGNGTLDLRTGELRQPDPADRISRGTDVNYEPDAPRQRWGQFVGEVFDHDPGLIAFVKRAYGSCCTGDTRDRALLIEYGSRFNGKSTLNRAAQRALGDFAHTAPIRVVMRTRQADIPNEIASLERKRMVLIAETADGHRLDENRVKLLTGRDKIAARALYREWHAFEPEFKLILFTNFKPRVDGSDGAVWDRIRLIPFRVSFADREDKTLDSKLAAEAEGILAWLVEGCMEWQENGLGSCDAVEQATDAYRTESDVIGRFVAECCELGDEHRVERKALRAALSAYCDDSGDDMPPATTLGRWLTERGIRAVKNAGQRSYRGIRLVGDGT